MTTLRYTFFLFVFLHSCKEKTVHEKPYNVRSDVRFGSKFFSIYLNEEGRAFVVKGNGSNYAEELKVESSDTSNIFELDSINLFLKNLNRLKDNPKIETNRTDAPRVEIYYNESKVYDVYKWDETFWDLFRPIMTQLPEGFNPFRLDEKPFG